MSVETIITLIALGIACLSGIIGIVLAVVRGDMKKFIIEKMEEAEEKYKDVEDKNEKSKLKLEYVINAVKEKYKVLDVILNIKKFVEYIIKITKKINSK